MQHVISFIVKFENFSFAESFVVTHVNLFPGLFLLHLFGLGIGLFGLSHHGARFVRFNFMFLAGLADPTLFLLELVLDGILEVFILECVPLFLFFLHDELWFFFGKVYLLDLSCILLVLDDFGVGFDLFELSAMHCCCYKVNNKRLSM